MHPKPYVKYRKGTISEQIAQMKQNVFHDLFDFAGMFYTGSAKFPVTDVHFLVVKAKKTRLFVVEYTKCDRG